MKLKLGLPTKSLTRWRLEEHMTPKRIYTGTLIAAALGLAVSTAAASVPLDKAIAEAGKANRASSKTQDKG